MNGPWGYYAKWNKQDWERQIPYGFTHMQNIKKTNKQIEPNMVMVTRGEDGEGEMVEGFSFMVTDGTFQW